MPQETLSMRQQHCSISIMDRMGELIRSGREGRKKTQRSVAANVGKEPAYMSRLESGQLKEFPPPDVLNAIAMEVGMPVRELLDAAGYALDERSDGDDLVPSPIRARLRSVEAWPTWKIKYVVSSIGAMEELQSAIDMDVRVGLMTPEEADTAFAYDRED